MKINFNWGTGIFVTTVIFIMISVGTTLFFMNQEVDLVDKNYYEKELVYQKQVTKLQKTSELGADVNISIDNKTILLQFPPDYITEKISGQIMLYRASSSKKDFVIPIALDSSGNQNISTNKMAKGLWKVQVEWSDGNTEFFTEKKVMVY